MPAVIFTGLEKLTCCQPLAVSLVDVAVASSVPVVAPQVNRYESRCSADPCRSGFP